MLCPNGRYLYSKQHFVFSRTKQPPELDNPDARERGERGKEGEREIRLGGGKKRRKEGGGEEGRGGGWERERTGWREAPSKGRGHGGKK